MNFGYYGEVLLLTRIVAPANLAPGTPVTLRAQGQLAGVRGATAFRKRRSCR